MEYLVPDVPVENIGEVSGRRAVYRAEVLRVRQIVDQLARIGVDHHRVEVPVAIPLGTVDFRQVRDLDAWCGRVTLGIIPDEQQPIDLAGLPASGFCLRRDALAVGNFCTATAGFELPVVKRTDDASIYQLALRQVSAHVRAMRIEDADRALVIGEGDQPCAKDVQGVKLAVAVIIGHAEAVPATSVSVFGSGSRWFDIDQLRHVVTLRRSSC